MSPAPLLPTGSYAPPEMMNTAPIPADQASGMFMGYPQSPPMSFYLVPPSPFPSNVQQQQQQPFPQQPPQQQQ